MKKAKHTDWRKGEKVEVWLLLRLARHALLYRPYQAMRDVHAKQVPFFFIDILYIRRDGRAEDI